MPVGVRLLENVCAIVVSGVRDKTNCSFHYHYCNGGENRIISLVAVMALEVNIFKQHELDWSLVTASN